MLLRSYRAESRGKLGGVASLLVEHVKSEGESR
jgi:hypothetical protein